LVIFVNLLIALVLAVLRIAGHKSEAFQAIAHMYVGGLFAWSVSEYRITKNKSLDAAIEAISIFVIAVVLSLIELTVALWQRFMG